MSDHSSIHKYQLIDTHYNSPNTTQATIYCDIYCWVVDLSVTPKDSRVLHQYQPSFQIGCPSNTLIALFALQSKAINACQWRVLLSPVQY